MNKIAGKVLVCIYLLLVVILTLYLFMYTRYGTSSVGKTILFSNNNIDSFKKGSLIIIKNNNNDYKIGDDIIFYNVYNMKSGVLHQKIVSKENTNDKEITYELNNNRFISSSNVIGKVKDSIEIPLLGYIFSILTSTMGYLVFALIPTLSLFIYQLNNILKRFDI